MHKLRALKVKKLALPLTLLVLAGCNGQIKTATKGSYSNSKAPLQQSKDREVLGGDQTKIGNLKISLHAKMLSFLDNLIANEAFAHLNNNSGEVENLVIVKHHPEIFVHQNKDSFVLCVSAKNNQGGIHPVDIYIKQGVGDDLFVYDMRVGDKEREILIEQMQKAVFSRL